MFQIVAREIGLNGLHANARVSVNLIDKNDNSPVFQKQSNRVEYRNGHRDDRKSKNMGLKEKTQETEQSNYDYEALVYENAQPGTMVLKVSTFFTHDISPRKIK